VSALQLMQHQTQALEKASGRPYFAYLMEMGTGKSLVACTELASEYLKGNIDAAIIVAPKGSYEDWATKHLPEASWTPENSVVYVWKGQGTKGERDQFRRVQEPTERMRFLIMNVEALSQGKGRAFLAVKDFMDKCKNVAMIVDESTVIKNPSAKRTKTIMEIGDKCVMRRILTGSPVTNSPLDVFSQFEFLEPRLLGFKSYFAFRHRYAVLREIDHGGRKFQIPVGFKNLDELREKVATHSFRVLKEDCLDLAPKTYATYSTEMSDTQIGIYASVKNLAMAALSETEYVSATSVITQIIRLHQIACGFVVDESGTFHDLGDNRVQDLLHVCEEISGSVVIWAAYRYDIAKIANALRKAYGSHQVMEYHGGVGQEERLEQRTKFQNGDIKFFVGNVQTGGRGVDLYKAQYTIYYSNNWDLELRQQSEDRTHRKGQTGNCHYVDLVVKNTVDEKIIHALRKKINIASTINGDNYREWLI
jgi:SNF2 family DNA or RNA helicase